MSLDQKLAQATPDPGVQRVLKSVVLFERMGIKRTIDFLEKHNVSGNKGNAASCVLAEYFKVLSNCDQVHVADYIQVGKFRFKTPKVLSYLWREFDHGKYPDLVRDNSPKIDVNALLHELKVEEVETPVPVDAHR